MYVAAAITSIAIGMTLLASIVRVVEVYPDEPEITVRQVVAPPEVRVVLDTTEATPAAERILPTPEPTPSPVLKALVQANAAPAVAARTIATPAPTPVPRPYVSPSIAARQAAIYAALERSSWPPHLWDRVVAIAGCESTWDPSEIGDSGLALGLLQIRSDAHPDIVARINVMTIDGALAGAWLVYTRAGHSFRPWSCA